MDNAKGFCIVCDFCYMCRRVMRSQQTNKCAGSGGTYGRVWEERMAKEYAKAFYNSKTWESCRRAYIAERRMADGGMCESCGKEPGYIVHHIEPLTADNITNPDVALNHSNLRYDCKGCHDREEAHAFVKQKQTLCGFDLSGQPIPPIHESR